MAAPIPCGVCGLMMDYVYDKRVKYCTPTCTKTAKKRATEEWHATHKPRKEHICQYCLKPIECCGSRQRKYHPECAIIMNRKSANTYNKRHQQELKEHSRLNRIAREYHEGDNGQVRYTSYDGFTDKRVPDDEDDEDKSPFNLSLVNVRQMNKICRDIERLCV